VDRNVGPPRRRLLSAIPLIQKSTGTLRKRKVEVSPRRIRDQLSAIDDDTNGRVMEILRQPLEGARSGAWIVNFFSRTSMQSERYLNYTGTQELY
jgi:hypothetical protein